jgi:hypothetical protein
LTLAKAIEDLAKLPNAAAGEWHLAQVLCFEKLTVESVFSPEQLGRCGLSGTPQRCIDSLLSLFPEAKQPK